MAAVPLELLAAIRPVAGQPELPDGWRGLIDFGETWTQAEQALWPSSAGPVPVGKPLTYGCVLHRPETKQQVRLTVFSLDEARAVMTRGAPLTLRDGHTARATGNLE